MKPPVRCPWCEGSDLYRRYHDEEWGVPVHDDRLLFEYLILEGAQAGLSWSTILNKRENYRRLYEGFEPARVARFSDERLEAMLQDSGIVRNRLKLWSSRANAAAFLRMQQAHGSFDAWLWSFVDGVPRVGHPATLAEVPARTALSDSISKALKKNGFNFVGSTIIQAFLQAVGVFNDHLLACHRHPSQQDPSRSPVLETP